MQDEMKIRWLSILWSHFFPKDNSKKLSIRDDPRLSCIDSFYNFFLDEGKKLVRKQDLFRNTQVHLDIRKLSSCFDDFDEIMRTQPLEVMGCIGLALSLIPSMKLTFGMNMPIFIQPIFYNLFPFTPFGELRSSTVGQLVSLRGYVVRVAPCKPLIIRAKFLCGKCFDTTEVYFEDGIFKNSTYPNVVIKHHSC